VSRVDTLVDKWIDERIAAGAERRDLLQSLKGKAAIANAKLAYVDFRKKFSTEAFAGLRNHGAHVQRPLWASTSTKNPAYPDVYYVEALVGPDSVDTMPPATIAAYKDHGNPEVRIDKGVDDARRVMDQLAEAGIHMDEVTRKLEEDGVAAFAKSFDSLIRVVDERRREKLGAAVEPVKAAKPAKAPVKAKPKAPAKAKPKSRQASAPKRAKKAKKAKKAAPARRAKRSSAVKRKKRASAAAAKRTRRPSARKAARKRPARKAAKGARKKRR